MACAPSWPGSSPTARPPPTSGPARRSASSAAATSTWTPSWTACGASRSAAGWWWSRTSCRAARSGSRGRPRNSGTTVPFFPNEGSDMPPSFRLGLIGAGRMGRTHMRAFTGSERVAVTAIAEVSEQARRAVAPSGAALYPGIGPMLDGAAVDGILITAPSDQHGRIISEVAARGLPILCEKPCGVTAAQTRAVASGLVPGGLGDPPDQAPDVDSAQVIVELSGGGTGFISLGRYHPAGDMARAEAFGTRGTVRCDFLDPAEGERAQLDAVRRQAESFAAFARGGPCEGATGADAIAALEAAEQASAAIRVGP